MSNALKAVALTLGLVAAVPASAQYRPRYAAPYGYGWPGNNALRLEVGGATLSSPGICTDSAYHSGNCVDTSPFAWQALTLGADLDLALGSSPISFTIGARDLLASYYSNDPSIFEPSLGVTFKFLRQAPISPRITLAGVLMIGHEGHTGGAFRLGGGVSFFNYSPIGLAVDLIFEVGAFGGYEMHQVSLAIGPEFRF